MIDLVAAAALGLLEIVVIQTGRLLVRAVSFGRWRAESMVDDESRIHAAAGALWFRREGRCVVTANGSLFLGIAFYVLAAVVAVVHFAA